MNPNFTIKKWGLRGSNLYRHVFGMGIQIHISLKTFLWTPMCISSTKLNYYLSYICINYTNKILFKLKERQICDLLFVLLNIKSLLKGVYSKRKEFAPPPPSCPLGSKSFRFRVDPIFRREQKRFDYFVVLVCIPRSLKKFVNELH